MASGVQWEKLISENSPQDHPANRAVWKRVVKDLQTAELPQGVKPVKEGNFNTPFLKRIAPMTPFVDDEGLLRGGGRLSRIYMTFGRKHPILIPDCPDGDALIGYIHAKVAQHQGRVITASTMRDEGILQ